MLFSGLTWQAFSKNIYPPYKIFFIQATLFVKRQILDYLGEFKIFAAIWNPAHLENYPYYPYLLQKEINQYSVVQIFIKPLQIYSNLIK